MSRQISYAHYDGRLDIERLRVLSLIYAQGWTPGCEPASVRAAAERMATYPR